MKLFTYSAIVTACSAALGLTLLSGERLFAAPDAPAAATAAPASPPPASTAPLPVLSADIPFDLTVTGKIDVTGLQHDFDVLSWDTFVAVNSPVPPGPAIGQNGDNATVWETWKDADQIFLPNGAKPGPWNAPATLPAICKEHLNPGMRLLSQIAKVPPALMDSVQPFQTGPLIDQNGRYARFEIVVNETAFNYIVDNSLYSKAGQKPVKKVVFPCGSKPDKAVGAIIIKAAWKVLSDEEKKSGRYHTAEAMVYSEKSENPPVEAKCEKLTVGLVGFHIVHKTASAPQWVWSTFEQVDNCPIDGEVASHPSYNFFDKNAVTAKVNEPPARPWNPDKIEPPARRSQIVRKIPLTQATKDLNAQYQAALKKVNPKSVWQYYELISTQWPTQPTTSCDVLATPQTDLAGAPAPQFLGNSTLESYIQGTVPNVSSSCMECHANAGATNAVFSDFTYLLQRAQ